MQIITAENISLQPTSTDTRTSPKPHTQYTTTIILEFHWISIDSYPGKNHTEWLRHTIQMASVGTPHTGHAQGPLKQVALYVRSVAH